MKDITDYQIAETMVTIGGSFCTILGRLYMVADGINQAKIREAFPDEWERYRELAQLKAKAK